MCAHLRKRSAAPRCQPFTGAHVAQAVTQAFLEVVEPARLAATLATFAQLEQPRVAREQLWQQRLERARYEVERARRQYNRVDPAHRLVARELETQWNTALPTGQALEQD